MANTAIDGVRGAASAVRNASAAAFRQAAAVSKEAIGEDTVENLAYAAGRATRKMKQGLLVADGVRADAAHRIKRQPFAAVGLTLAVGFGIGFVLGRLGLRRRLVTTPDDE